MPTTPWNLSYTESRRSGYWPVSNPANFTDTSLRGAGVLPSGSIAGTTNRNYKVNIAKRVEAGTNYTKQGISRYDIKAAKGEFYDTYAGGLRGRCLWAKTTWPAAFGVVPDDAGLSSLALTRLKQKLAKNTNSVNILVPLAELREMRGLIRSTALLTTNMLNAMISVKRTKGASAARYASDIWLDFNFGINPLVQDTIEISQAIASFMATSKERTVVLTGRASSEYVTGAKDVIAGSLTGLSASLASTMALHHKLSYKYTAGFTVPVLSANNYGVLDQLGVEVEGIVPALWELTPYSWAVDYFTNVGAYLDDTFTTTSGDTYYVSLSKLYTCNLVGDLHYLVNGTTKVTSEVPGHLELDYLYYNRSYLTKLPHASLRFKSIDELAKNAVNKVANLASILVGRNTSSLAGKPAKSHPALRQFRQRG